jgi:sulfite reductase (NADPH) flavoprotein alpha-component
MITPTLPDSAPFSTAQRAWLNGFFAAILSGKNGAPAAATNGAGLAAPAKPPEPEETFPWHDSALPLAERLELSKDRAKPRRLMSAMAQLNCGACGYLCQTYAEALADGTEKDVTKCSPGGGDTAKALKQLLVELKDEPKSVKPAAEVNGHHTNGHALPTLVKNGSTVDEKPTWTRAKPFSARLVSSTLLTSIDAPKDTRHVVIDLLDSGITYKPGDALGIMPLNDDEVVDAVIKQLGATGGERVASNAGGSTSLRHALRTEYALNRVRSDVVELLDKHAKGDADKRLLAEALATDGHALVQGDVADALAMAPTARVPVDDFLGTLAKLQPRLYSISSSQRMHPQEVHLTVGVVRYEAAGRARAGVASHFLGVRSLPGDEVRVFVQPSKFRLPENPQTPVIMIGPGTGIAPFRAFLEERAAASEKGPMWLLFGNQYFHHDFLYKEELDGFTNSGTLTRLDLAFSRDQMEKIYVQDRIREHGQEFWKWLQQGAGIYICGDAKRMAPDVEAAIKQVMSQHGGMSAEEAKAYLDRMRKEHRYHKDVY